MLNKLVIPLIAHRAVRLHDRPDIASAPVKVSGEGLLSHCLVERASPIYYRVDALNTVHAHERKAEDVVVAYGGGGLVGHTLVGEHNLPIAAALDVGRHRAAGCCLMQGDRAPRCIALDPGDCLAPVDHVGHNDVPKVKAIGVIVGMVQQPVDVMPRRQRLLAIVPSDIEALRQ